MNLFHSLNKSRLVQYIYCHLEGLPGDVDVEGGEVLGQGEVSELAFHPGVLLTHLDRTIIK